MPLPPSIEKEVQSPPPVGGFFGDSLVHVRRASPVSATPLNCQTTWPSSASSAYTLPVTPKLSPPALPTNTRPFQARGAMGADSPLAGSPNETSHRVFPVLASIAYACTSFDVRNNLP